MEQPIETFAPGLLPLPMVISEHFDPLCAWCLKKRGIKPKETDSHGICRVCEAIWLAESKAKLAFQRAARALQKAQQAEIECQCTMTPEGRVVCNLCEAKRTEHEAAEVFKRINTWLSTLPSQKEMVEV